MPTALAVVLQTASDALKPDPKLKVSAWAGKNVRLPAKATAESGLYRVKRTPYMREILDELGALSRTQTITVMKGAQVGATEAANVALCYWVAHQPGPTLYVLPTLDAAKRTSKQRIAPIFKSTPAVHELIDKLPTKETSTSVMEKDFPGGVLFFVGSNSASGLRSLPIRYLVLDEISAFEADVQNEGDPIELARRRTTAGFRRNRKIFQISTPKIKGSCKIEREWLRSDRRYYHVPCPHCKELQKIDWKRIKWDKDDDGNHLPDTAHLECEHCRFPIGEHHKAWMLAEDNGAKWIPTAEGEKGHRGYHVSSLYSPWKPWSDVVSEFLAAKTLADRGDMTKLKEWTNSVLGETWESKGTSVSHHALWRRREPYKAQVPQDAAYLTCGVDVQDDRLEALVIGWGKNEEAWIVDHRVFYGDPSDRQDDCWRKLDELIYATEFEHESGHKLRISYAAIDSGFLATKVYDYIKDKRNRGVVAVKGDSGKEGAPLITNAKSQKTGRDKRPVPLFMVGGFESKRLIYSRLLLESPGPGYIHIPINDDFVTDEFLRQLTAERIEEHYQKGYIRRSFVKKHSANEVLDMMVYAQAAYHIARPNIDRYAELLTVVEEEPEATEEQTETLQPEPQAQKRRTRRRKRGGFVTNW